MTEMIANDPQDEESFLKVKLAAIRLGDESEFNVIYTRLYPILHRYFRSKGFGDADSDDETQNLALRILQRLSATQSDAVPIRTWEDLVRYSLKAARFRAIDKWRSDSGKKPVSIEVIAESASHEKNALELMVDREEQEARQETLNACVSRLEKRDQQIFLLQFMLCPKEIADRLQLTAQFIHRRWHSIKGKIAACVRAKLEGGERQ